MAVMLMVMVMLMLMLMLMAGPQHLIPLLRLQILQ